MYRSDLKPSDRAGTIALVALIHLGLAYAFLNVSGTMRTIERQIIPRLIDVDLEPPPPPIVEVPLEKEKPKEKEGAASPKNIKSEATPVAAPKPRIALPVPPPMPVTDTPREGSDPTQGAADVVGPGTGAGGVGTGTGSGGSGTGTGGGGGGGVAVRSTVVRGVTNRDYPVQIQRSWPRNGAIFVRLRVEANGRPSQCDVMRGYGDRMADQWTCSLLMERGVFRPARDARGQPVADWLGYVQRDLGRFDR
jgi:protein TonB